MEPSVGWCRDSSGFSLSSSGCRGVRQSQTLWWSALSIAKSTGKYQAELSLRDFDRRESCDGSFFNSPLNPKRMLQLSSFTRSSSGSSTTRAACSLDSSIRDSWSDRVRSEYYVHQVARDQVVRSSRELQSVDSGQVTFISFRSMRCISDRVFARSLHARYGYMHLFLRARAPQNPAWHPGCDITGAKILVPRISLPQ